MGNNANWIIDWIIRMTHRYGGKVYEKNRYMWWDWGQAIAREQYGEDWNDIVPAEPSNEDVLRAREWEQGNIPSWVDQKRMGIIVQEKQR